MIKLSLYLFLLIILVKSESETESMPSNSDEIHNLNRSKKYPKIHVTVSTVQKSISGIDTVERSKSSKENDAEM